MSEWISVKERLPTIGAKVLVYFANEPGGSYMDVWKFDGKNQYFRDKPSPCPHQDVTHWMPLPDPPKGKPRIAIPDKTSDSQSGK